MCPMTSWNEYGLLTYLFIYIQKQKRKVAKTVGSRGQVDKNTVIEISFQLMFAARQVYVAGCCKVMVSHGFSTRGTKLLVYSSD